MIVTIGNLIKIALDWLIEADTVDHVTEHFSMTDLLVNMQNQRCTNR